MSNIPHFENLVISLNLVQNKIESFLDQDQTRELTDSIDLANSSDEGEALEGLFNALKVISEFEIGKIHLIQTLRSFGLDIENDFPSSIRSYIVTKHKSPGLLLHCPADPTHYSKRQSFQNEVIICPLHKIELVPDNSNVNQ